MWRWNLEAGGSYPFLPLHQYVALIARAFWLGTFARQTNGYSNKSVAPLVVCLLSAARVFVLVLAIIAIDLSLGYISLEMSSTFMSARWVVETVKDIYITKGTLLLRPNRE